MEQKWVTNLDQRKTPVEKNNNLWFINPLLVSIYTFWNHQKASGFLMFSEATQKGQRHEMGL